MGNCFGSSCRVNASQTTAGVSTTKPTSNSCDQSTLFPSSSLVGTSLLFSDKSYETNNPALRSEWEILACPNLKPFTFTDLKNATRNFQTLLGEGGFGYVYKGWLHEQTLTATKPGSGMTVAVKNLKPEGFQGHKEWLTEVDYLGQLDHPNIVKLVGYCSEGENRLLVYEFLPKGNVESHLFRRGSQPMPWEWRMKVATDAARGLSFLHDSGVIFRDFKASNILLDAEFNAKLSDFGLAKAGPTGDRTHVSTQVVGTQGYAAPEYIATGRLTANCDIYSFGVFLVELLSGRRALYKTKVGIDQILADWARPHLRDRRKLFRLMDSKLEGQYPKKLAHTVSTLAMECLRADAKQRPKMTAVLTVLEQISTSKHSKTSLKPVMKCPRRLRSPMNPAPIASSPRQLRSPVSLTTNGSSSPLPSRSPHVY